ncbi:hypothetical protein B7486_76930, partial [cyanobacterium TDX16]
AIHDTTELDAVVTDLVEREYLRLSDDRTHRIRAGHERVVVAVRALLDDEVGEDVRRSLIDEIATALDSGDDTEETYLLHCLVGLQTAREITGNVHHISRLIQAQYRQDQFSYLVALADEIQDVLPLLPPHALRDLLDALQKSSAFERGLEIIQVLDASHVPGTEERRAYRLRYLTQAYR